MIILSAENGYDTVRRQVHVYYLIREGDVISHITLSETNVVLGKKEIINFKIYYIIM